MENQGKGISSFQKHLTWWVLGCMAVGVLTEVPVMLTLVKMANKTKERF